MRILAIDPVGQAPDPAEPVAAADAGAELDLLPAGREIAGRLDFLGELALRQRHFAVLRGDHHIGAELVALLLQPLHDLGVAAADAAVRRRVAIPGIDSDSPAWNGGGSRLLAVTIFLPIESINAPVESGRKTAAILPQCAAPAVYPPDAMQKSLPRQTARSLNPPANVLEPYTFFESVRDHPFQPLDTDA